MMLEKRGMNQMVVQKLRSQPNRLRLSGVLAAFTHREPFHDVLWWHLVWQSEHVKICENRTLFYKYWNYPLSLKHATFAASYNHSFLLCSFLQPIHYDLWFLLTNERPVVSSSGFLFLFYWTIWACVQVSSESIPGPRNVMSGLIYIIILEGYLLSS